jgi:hypothetical protein
MMVRTAKRLDFERIDEGDLSIGSTQLGALPFGDPTLTRARMRAHRAPNAPNELLQHVSGATFDWTVLYRFGGGFGDGNSVPWTRLAISLSISTNACGSIPSGGSIGLARERGRLAITMRKPPNDDSCLYWFCATGLPMQS